jgi:hypothetical protein
LTLKTISLKIETPTDEETPGRGFYQLEEDSLYVQVGEFGPTRGFFNYLEADGVRFDIDKTGRLSLIEVPVARRQWILEPELAAPTIAEPADVRWLDFRTPILDPELVTDPRRTTLLVRFSLDGSPNWYRLADTVFLSADPDHRLCAVMIVDIEDDLAGQQIALFRRKANRRLRRARQAVAHRTVSD